MNNNSNDGVVILSGVRTPIGSFCGSLASFKAHELGSIVIKEALARANVEPEQVTEVIFGHVLTAGQGQNPARQASINAGLPHTVPSTSVNMLCGSGLRSVVMGAQAIQSGDADIVVAGGQESMSQAQHSIHLRTGMKMGDGALTDTMVLDGLTDAFNHYHMGITAENIAKQFKIAREDQDKFALLSQQKTATAQSEGLFKEEIVSVIVKGRKSDTVVEVDEFPKNDTSLETLSKLRPAFVRDSSGTVTAGNASGLNDGAAAVVLCSESLAKANKMKPIARIVSYASAGVDPAIMGTGPIPAIRSALKRAAWSIDDVDLFEVNEAFAAQSLQVVRELGIDQSRVNIRGGAIALGHPIGASGARVLVTLLHALKQNGQKKGVAGLCIGGGMGIAMCVEIL